MHVLLGLVEMKTLSWQSYVSEGCQKIGTEVSRAAGRNVSI